jgi:hypothetical protein
MKIKRLYEDSRISDKTLEKSVQEFIQANRENIDSMASEELWEQIYELLISNFPDADEDILITIFNKEYGTPMEESEEDEDGEGDHRKTENLPGMPYTSWSRSALGVNQKLTESIKRLRDF